MCEQGENIMYYLQSRWVEDGNKLYYYGLRNRENLFRNSVALSKKQKKIIDALPKELNADEKKTLGDLLGVQVVKKEKLKSVPTKLSEARFCSECCANDFMIPGLEFDEHGRCPMCQTAEETKDLKSILPILNEIPHSKKCRFDVALFYTGGKDSTFLLYYLSVIKGLRVLALTWEIPFMSESAKASIEGAKKIFCNAEFISRTVSSADLNKIYRKLYELNGNTCACPSLAYVLFYPELTENRIPYFVAGNEPVQMLALYYNRIAPKIAYSFANNRLLTALYNIGRICTLHPPLRQGQIQTLMTMKQLAYGDNIIKKYSGFQGEPVSGIVKAIREVPEMLLPLKKSIRRSSRLGTVPAFVHIDMDEICGGTYDWNNVKDILIRECGWVAPDESRKALHTSCKIERCKDHTQFLRFYRCESKLIPFSALEIALSSRNCGRSREETMHEIEHFLGFSLTELPECELMRQYTEEQNG